MSKPYELVEAEMVYGLCQAYHALPEAGGILDQSVSLLRMQAILAAGGYFDGDGAVRAGRGAASDDDPFSGIPMVAL